MKNGLEAVKKSRDKRIRHYRNIKTEPETLPLQTEANKIVKQKCQSYFNAVKGLCMRDKKSKPHILNLSIPVIPNTGEKNRGESLLNRINNFKDFFIARLRRKQQARSKILLERLESESKSVSLIELSQKWLTTTKPIQNLKSRAQTIKQMRNNVRQRNEFCSSEGRLQSEDQHLFRVNRHINQQ